VSEIKYQLSLDRPATYQIKVPGHLNKHWSGWAENMMIMGENDDDGLPITTLTGVVDQAALLSLLRRLYSLGLPLISAICIRVGDPSPDKITNQTTPPDHILVPSKDTLPPL
jgi:hypothetical protein